MDETKSNELRWREKDDAHAALVLLYDARHDCLPSAVSCDKGLVVGREPPPGGLVLDDASVSRVHARISRIKGGWEIADLESRNGTVQNGRPITSAPLEHLDEIRIGDTIFKFVEEPADAYVGFRLGDASGELVGGAQMESLRREIGKLATASLSVVVAGETGTGKEIVARLLHQASGREGSFVAVNCAAIPANLLESELFGYKRGAFTGADRDRAGAVRAAHRGTLLLDEIGDMPLDAQAKVLRVLETREVVPLGATTGDRVDVRLVCATHKNIRKLVDDGAFRADLYGRIHGHTLRLPPLRDRKEDIFALVKTFLARAKRPDLRVSFRFMLGALHYDWPFNVRELMAAIDRATVLSESAEISETLLPDEALLEMKSYGQKETPTETRSVPPREAPTEEQLREILTRHRGSIAAAARELHRDRVQVRRWMKRFSLTSDDFR